MSTKRSKLREQSAYSRKPWLKHYDFWVPEQMNFPRQPIHQILNLAALQFTEKDGQPNSADADEGSQACPGDRGGAGPVVETLRRPLTIGAIADAVDRLMGCRSPVLSP